MVLRVYDTAAREVLAIPEGGTLRIYACGPTVYRDAHVGNMRTFLLTDLVRRAVAFGGRPVRVVQNITDVGHMLDDTGLGGADEGQDGEDRMLVQSGLEGRGALEIARFYEDRFRADLARLNITPADESPRASESIALMLTTIATLMQRGHAYIGTDGSVFFDARSVRDYGALSGNRLDALRPGHRFDDAVDPAKRFHADWALWKRAPATRTQLVWDSPWGPGFPGWHIECTAMSLDRLGDRIDVHVGGIDLRFPHHEDERAQSNAVVGHEVVARWLHGEHLLFEGRKMSKSAGNVVLVSDLIAHGLDPLALRLAFLEHRYRTQMNLTWASLEAADATLRRWRDRVAHWAESPSGPADVDTVAQVRAAFDDDLDTPRAIAAVRALERSDVDPGVKFETFALLDRLLGLDLVRLVGRARPALPAGAAELLERRAAARATKDWAASDALRDELATLGVTVRDTPDGQAVD